MDKLCIYCKHCIMEFGHPSYSDLTPGEEWEFSCHKRGSLKLSISGCDTTREEYIKEIRKAQGCKMYEIAEGLK